MSDSGEPKRTCCTELHGLICCCRRFHLRIANSVNESRRHHRDGFGAVLLRNFVERPAPPITCADVLRFELRAETDVYGFLVRAIATGAAFAKLGGGIRCDD